jgi:hypothetical protein
MQPKTGFRDYDFQEIQMSNMVGNIARWGSNALLVGMAVLTYAVFVLAR